MKAENIDPKGKLEKESKEKLVKLLVQNRNSLVQKEMQLNNLKAEISSIHNSKTWKLWLVYRSIKNFILNPLNYIPIYRINRQNLVYRNAEIETWEKKLPLVSVVIPCFNYGHFLENCIESLKRQTLNRLEIIVVDDGSTNPETKKVLKKIEKQGVLVIYQENNGVSVARNIGINEARGKYVCCIDPDDYFEPTYLEKCLWLLETNLNIGFAFSWAKLFDGSDEVWKTIDFDIGSALGINTTSVSAVMRKSAWMEVGGYKSNISYEDWELWISLGEVGWGGKVIEEPLFLYRIHNESKTSEDIKRHSETMTQIRELHKELYRSHGRLKLRKVPKQWPQPSQFNLDAISKDIYPKKIAVFVPWVVRGGADKVLLDILRELKKKDFEFVIFTTLLEKSDWISKYSEITKEVFDLHNFLDPAYWELFCMNYLTKNKISKIVISQSRWSYSFAAMFKEVNPKTKVLDIIKNGSIHGHSDLSKLFDHVINQTVVPSDIVSKEIVSNGVLEEQVKIINDGINLEEFKPPKEIDILNSKINLGFTPESKIITFLGRFSDEKDPLLFLSIAKLFSKNHEIKFVLVGEGPLHNILKRKIKNAKLTNVLLLPFRENVSPILNATDILVNTSKIEGVPLTLMEALAQNVPAIAPNVGGVSSLLPKEFIVFERNAEAFYYKILEILERKPENKLLREIAVKKADIKNTAIEFAKLLNED